MDKSFLFKLKDGMIERLEEYYYSSNLVEKEEDWVDYAVLYTTEIEVYTKRYKTTITIQNKYTEPEYTVMDLVSLLNESSGFIVDINEREFSKWLEFQVEFDDKNEDVYDINFQVEVI